MKATQPLLQADPKTLLLLPEQFQAVAKAHGWTSNAALGRALGMSAEQVRRVLRGEIPPNASFIGGVLLAAPELGFRRIFEPVVASPQKGQEVI